MCIERYLEFFMGKIGRAGTPFDIKHPAFRYALPPGPVLTQESQRCQLLGKARQGCRSGLGCFRNLG